MAERLRRKTFHFTPLFFFFFFWFFLVLFCFFLFVKKKTNQLAEKEKKRQLVQACRVRANLTLGREVYLYQDRKAVARRALSVIPVKYLQKFLKTKRETIYGWTKWFHNKYAKYAQDMTI
jgi:hypothetical protein